MTQFQAFRRVAVPPQIAEQVQVTTLPAPTRGLIESENYAFMQPGGAVVLDNWKPTMRSIQVRGGIVRWCELDPEPVVSAFEYSSGNIQRMFAGQASKLFDVTFSGGPTLVKDSQASGNYCASQLANMSGDYMIVLNDAGDFPLRFDGTTWITLDADQITADPTQYPGASVAHGKNLTYVCKYRNRWFFIEGGTMNAWYLGIDSIGGQLELIPLSGAATQGGKLLFCAVWNIDAGDGIDDKLVFCTNHGELLIFTGSNPADAANWRQEGRYQIPPPMGMNAHIALGGDLLIATTEGIVPVSAAITKTSGDLDLAMITKNIKTTWRQEAITKDVLPWTMERWDEYGGMFVTLPGGKVGKRYCLVVNTGTGAWARFTGWDATCWIRMRGDMFFGTQDGFIQQADRGGNDDGVQYVATMVGGWEMFQSAAQTIVWKQARASLTSKANASSQPQLSACTDYIVSIPPPPPADVDPGILDVWDQGLWDQAKWDQDVAVFSVVHNTGWVSIGLTGYSHAPVVQITMNQRAKPDVELINISATYERCGVNV